MQLWLCPILAFLLGSIPFGLIIARLKGIDIRQHGSGNIGATNVLRVIGKKYGITCLLLDALKGFIPVAIAVNLIQIESRRAGIPVPALDSFAVHLPSAQQLTAQLIHVLTGLAAILGHNYSPWVGFKGGKGIATSAGVLLALMPAAVILLIGVWLMFFTATRYVSVASIAAAAALPLLTHVGARFHHVNNDKSLPTLWEAGTWNKPLFIFSVIIAILAIWKHRANIQRLLNGTENRFQPKKKKSNA
ncbi:MAG: glycerol-3-phosphate 1-O-acyltransferase [Verrucomicrobia bacterium]|nr:MAG: glycerol-3-phosphate 1-O-acyltransferase [Verrucomicrobiota bacterium]TAE86218.1 MAG: glycerol-3-phosphate 1-O-acyltransferase [Verrucomicrobiota bacterium]TAF23664.1 MAG: glycerol-3-phosphate 1-O-acyltransferase [Verrucomicrobiota bacterium]TAF40207.1 MAG: glycerol-3-phosphate 1-O-acyltransferase [Verrucomicrobiota bacterium]